MESTQKIINDNPDSLEIGTPGKLGAIKMYGDFNNLEDFKAKIEEATDMTATKTWYGIRPIFLLEGN